MEIPMPARKSRAPIAAAVIIVIIISGIGGWLIFGNQPTVTTTTTTTTTTSASPTTSTTTMPTSSTTSTIMTTTTTTTTIIPPEGSVLIGQLVTPGAPPETPSNHIIVVGLLDPMTEIQGEEAWRGSYMACEEINLAGGVVVNSETYYFGLIAEDTSELEPELNTSKGVAAATKIINEDNAQFVIGGFGYEAVLDYRETIMDEEILFLGTGVSLDPLCQDVIDTYARYKYFFRAMPINKTSMALSLLNYILYLDGYLTSVTGENITKVAIIREDLDWTVGMSLFLYAYLPLYGLEIVREVAFPMTAEASDFATYWQVIDASGAQITIPIISAGGGIPMTTEYAQVQPKCIMAGIDVMSQLDTFWEDTAGACQYEIIMQSVMRTNKTTKTIPFWDAYTTKFDSEPFYTAVGSYDAMYILKEGILDAQSLNSTDIIPYLETMNRDNPMEGAGGNIAFTVGHDLYEGYIGSEIYSVTLFCQWQANDEKECVSTGGLVYPEYVVTATLSIPPWGINP